MYAYRSGSDQSARTRRLIWVFSVRKDGRVPLSLIASKFDSARDSFRNKALIEILTFVKVWLR